MKRGSIGWGLVFRGSATFTKKRPIFKASNWRGPRLGGTKVVTFGIRALRSAQRLLTHAPALPTSSTAPPPSILSSSPPGAASSSFTSCWKAAMGMERLDWSHRDGPQSEALRTVSGLCSGFPLYNHLSHDDARLAHAQQALTARRNPISMQCK